MEAREMLRGLDDEEMDEARPVCCSSIYLIDKHKYK